MSNIIVREEYFGASYIRQKNLTFGFLNNWQSQFLRDVDKNSLERAITMNRTVSSTELEAFIERGKKEGFFDSNGNSAYDFRKSLEPTSELPHGVLKSPIRTYFEITRKCNLHCANCFSSSGKAYCDEFSHDEVIKTLDGLRAADVLEVRITGGEPTQRERWDEIARHAKQIGLAVSLNTNGVYSSPKVREEIINAGVDQVIVSLDGDKKAHDSLRGNGNYERTLESIKYFSGKANNLRVNTLLRNESLGAVPSMVELAEKYNTEICFILLRPVGRATDLANAIPNTEKLYETIGEINELRKKYPHRKIMTSYDVISANAIKPAPDLDLTGCSAGLRGIVINSLGRMESCGFLAELTDEYSPGNIRDYNYSLIEPWRNSEKLKAFRELNLRRNSTCIACDKFKSNCLGTCAAMDVYKNVNPGSCDPYCLIDRMT